MLVAVLIATVLVMPARASHLSAGCTCGCITRGEDIERLRAEVAFVGRVTRFDTLPAPPRGRSAAPRRVVARFVVTRKVWGVTSSTLMLDAGDVAGGASNCSFGFQAGASYLIFANRSGSAGILVTDACSGNAVADAAETILYHLRQSRRIDGTQQSSDKRSAAAVKPM